MKIAIQITMDNAAFTDRKAAETARILSGLVAHLENDTIRSVDGLKLYDINGNAVGTVKLSGKGA